MPHAFSGGIGLSLLMSLHLLAAFAFAIGVVFLLTWSVKHLSGATLWKWGWILAIGGAVIAILTIAAQPSFGSRSFGGSPFDNGSSWQAPMYRGHPSWYDNGDDQEQAPDDGTTDGSGSNAT